MRDDENLCFAERALRLRRALLTLSVAIVMVIVLSEVEAAPIWWVSLLVPVFPTSLLLVQAYTGVCVFHAHDGTRSVNGVVEPMLDPRKRRHVAAIGRRNYIATGVLGTMATALVVALASLR